MTTDELARLGFSALDDLEHVFQREGLEVQAVARCRSRSRTVSGLQLIMIVFEPGNRESAKDACTP